MRPNHLPSNTFTPKQLAMALHVSISTVYRRLPQRRLPYCREDILILRKRGLSVRDIEFVLGAPRSTIHRVLTNQ